MLFSPWYLLLRSGILWARFQHLLYYNQSNLKNPFLLPLQCVTGIKQKRFKSITYILDAPIGNKIPRGIKEKSNFIISLVVQVITLENVPKELPGWLFSEKQAIFRKTRHHTYMNMKECISCMPSSQSSITLFDGRWHSKQRDQWCLSCVDMYLIMFQPQILPPHFSIFSTGQKILMAESLPAWGFFVVAPMKGKVHHSHSKIHCPGGVIEEWQTEKQ